MIRSQATISNGQLLTEDEIRNTLGVLEGQFASQRVLVLIPDHTRSLPLPFLFRSLVDVLHDAIRICAVPRLATTG